MCYSRFFKYIYFKIWYLLIIGGYATFRKVGHIDDEK